MNEPGDGEFGEMTDPLDDVLDEAQEKREEAKAVKTTPLARYTGHLVEGMKWSKEKPTRVGFYWYRSALFPLPERISEIEPIDIAASEKDPDYYEKTSEWSGPIPLPSEVPAQGWYKADEVEELLKDRQMLGYLAGLERAAEIANRLGAHEARNAILFQKDTKA